MMSSPGLKPSVRRVVKPSERIGAQTRRIAKVAAMRNVRNID